MTFSLPNQVDSRRVIGLMSGTSVDGIDCALTHLSGSGAQVGANLVAFKCVPFEPALQERILDAVRGVADVVEVARLNVALGEAFAAAANQVIAAHGPVDLIGSHGQTVCHLPAEGVTLQLGEAATIAKPVRPPRAWRPGIHIRCPEPTKNPRCHWGQWGFFVRTRLRRVDAD